MKWVLRILGLVIGLIVLLLLIGFLLPADYHASRSAVLASPPEKLWPLLEDPRQWARWSVWNRRDPAMQMSYSGAARGAGAEWAWKSKSEGNGSMRFTAAEAPHCLAYELRFEDFDGDNTGEITLEPEGNGTRATWTMAGRMGKNPINRWFGLFMDRMVGPDFENGLRNLDEAAKANAP